MDYQNNITTTELTTTSGYGYGGSFGGGYWMDGVWHPYIQPYVWPVVTQPVHYYFHTVQEPTTCIGKAHVFACDHEPKCLCGKVERVMSKLEKAKGKR